MNCVRVVHTCVSCEEGGVHLGLAISGPPGVRVGLDVGKVDPGVAGRCRGNALPLIADVSEWDPGGNT